MSRYFKIGRRRMTGLILGNVLLGLGVSLFKFSGMGNDPFSAMIMSLSKQLGLPYSTFLVILNLFIFIVEITLGRKYIGLGTFANWLLVGYVAEFFIWLTNTFLPHPGNLLSQLLYVILGVIIISLGASLYQTADAGIAPYDSVSLIMDERISMLPYFWCRMICDITCVIICLLSGGLIGLGTFLCALGLGPVIHFFNHRISQKAIYPNGRVPV